MLLFQMHLKTIKLKEIIFWFKKNFQKKLKNIHIKNRLMMINLCF